MIQHKEKNTGFAPVNIELAKIYCKVDAADEDDTFYVLIKSAAQLAEKITGKQAYTEKEIERKYSYQQWDENMGAYALDLPYDNCAYSDISLSWQPLKGELVNLTISDYRQSYSSLFVFKRFNEDGYFILTCKTSIDETEQEHFQLPILKLIADAFMNREEQGIEALSFVQINAQAYLKQLQNPETWI